jgi:RTA1 like protein
MLQAVGGGMAGGADGNVHLRNMGTDLMIAGIVWQVATLVVFACLAIDYVVRTSRVWDQVPSGAKILAVKVSFKLFVAGVALAFLTIFCRCVYRIAEMVQGWANPVMRDQAGFVIAEGLYAPHISP